MPVSFPHAGGFQVSDQRFLAAWKAHFSRNGPEGARPLDGWLPILGRRETLEQQLLKGHLWSLDVLCRLLVPVTYRNTMQATPAFLVANRHLLSSAERVVTNRRSGRMVAGARLAPELGHITEIPEDDGPFEADIDVPSAPLQAEVSASPDHAEVPSTAEAPSGPWPRHVIPGPANLVSLLVDQIECDPFRAAYRRQWVDGQPIAGWTHRLAAYFWPNPGVGAAAAHATWSLFQARARLLIGPAAAWSAAQELAAVQLARDVFDWGRVPQTFEASDVRAVFDSVLSGNAVPTAPMNSGWTKLAAVFSEAMPGADPLVIWDSRVAHALIRRIDGLLFEAGHRQVPSWPCLQNIGRVQGQGGTRVCAHYHLAWPNGYARWATQFAASALVRAIRDELNGSNAPAGATEKATPWTLREVEMVLFMDGY